MKNPRIVFFLLFLFLGCSKSEVSKEKRFRLKSYNIVYSEPQKNEVYRGFYVYNTDDRLISETQNDTTYLLNSNQIIPVETTISYEYNTEGFLVKRTQVAVSIRLFATVVTSYEYKNGLLSLEDLGNNVREYRYDGANKLKTTIFTSKTNGSKTVVDYNDDIPLALIKTENGYLIEQNNEKTYLNNDLLVKRYEKYQNDALIFEQDYIQQKMGLPQSALPKFKGFPKIKAFDYRKGIENEITTYKHIAGKRILSDQKILNSTFDQNGFLIENIGFEHINQETASPLRRGLLFEYTYEEY